MSAKTLSYADTSSGRGERTFIAPYLAVAMRCRSPLLAPARFSVAEVERVYIRRGAVRQVERRHEDGRACLILEESDSWLSSEHARVVKTFDTWYVEDAGSKNGTFLNGTPVARARLADGDIIQAGGSLFVFRNAVERGIRDPADLDLAGAGGPVALNTLHAGLYRQFARLHRVAQSETPILIGGQSGTGKEMIARSIHELSGRPGPYTAINCGAIPPALVESQLFGHKRGAFSGAVADSAGLIGAAHRGTLFLDEVAELPETSQVALLRVLQEREVIPIGSARPRKVDIRVVAATHQDLTARTADGRFRTDLYARLAGFELTMPPLAARLEDVGLIIATLLRKLQGEAAPGVRFARSAARALFNYPWPLNVREMEHALQTALAIADGAEITLECLPPAVREAAGRRVVIADIDREPKVGQLRDALRNAGGNVSAAARDLGCSRGHLHRLLKKYGVDPSDYRK